MAPDLSSEIYPFKITIETDDPASPLETAYLINVTVDAISLEICAKNLPIDTPLREIGEALAREKCADLFAKTKGAKPAKITVAPAFQQTTSLFCLELEGISIRELMPVVMPPIRRFAVRHPRPVSLDTALAV